MCDIGRTSKTVPFDKLTDCDVQEPAGTAVCCCVQNRLMLVTVDTASGREMVLRGLKDPFQFKVRAPPDARRPAPRAPALTPSPPAPHGAPLALDPSRRTCGR